MPVGRMKARRPLRVFLSAGGEGYELGRRWRGRRVKGAEGEDEVGHAGELFRGDGLPRARPRWRAAMEPQATASPWRRSL